MFFDEGREYFFRLLTGKYRAQIMACLSAFYGRLYGSLADYSRSFNREQVIEVLQEAIARSPVLDDEDGAEFNVPSRSQREQANWVLNQLLDCGWLERQMDEATLQSSYAFTRYGRLFTEPMVASAGGRFRTRHRNTRNTRNALQSFLHKGEIYDLLDAFECSERIIADFSDLIAELDDRKRQLVKAVASQQVIQNACDEFFDFMEKRFMPDISIRLSADSVEKYRDEIDQLIAKAQRKRREFKADAERELRRVAPELVTEPTRSVYLMVLEGIETRMHNASEVMLPALRQALNSFTRRADIIMRQLRYANAGMQDRLYGLCDRLKLQTDDGQRLALEQAGRAMASLRLGFVDPESLKLRAGRQQRIVNTAVEELREGDQESRKQLFVQAAVDQAFTFNNLQQRQYLAKLLAAGHRLHSSELPVCDARELLMSAHVVEMGALSSSEFAFRVTPTDHRVSTDYFTETDDFVVELIEKD